MYRMIFNMPHVAISQKPFNLYLPGASLVIDKYNKSRKLSYHIFKASEFLGNFSVKFPVLKRAKNSNVNKI
jgi:hypothetical protein